jgi:aspartate/methionine/tyrosine aminotransferase
MQAAFDRRRRRMHEMLAATPGVTCVEPQGAFYCFPSFRSLLDGRIDGITTSLDLAALILDEAEVAMVPGEAFGAAGYGRFSYALSDADLERGLTRMQGMFARRV